MSDSVDVDTGYTADDIPEAGPVYNACADEIHYVQAVRGEDEVLLESPYHGTQIYSTQHLVPVRDHDLKEIQKAIGRAEMMGYDAALEVLSELLEALEETERALGDWIGAENKGEFYLRWQDGLSDTAEVARSVLKRAKDDD